MRVRKMSIFPVHRQVRKTMFSTGWQTFGDSLSHSMCDALKSWHFFFTGEGHEQRDDSTVMSQPMTIYLTFSGLDWKR